MIPREILKKIRQIELRTNRIVTRSLAGICCLSLLLLCSCATGHTARLSLPPEVAMNAEAGHDDLYVTLSLEDGEELLFILDTGSVQTTLHRSLEPKLGKRLGTRKSRWAFYENDGGNGIYSAPKLYLNGTPLVLGPRVETADLKPHSDPRVRGVLGMDCLRHYCLQLDFQTRRIRFLDPDTLDDRNLGQAFPLTIYFGGVSTQADLFSIGEVSFRTDTGFVNGDFLLKSRSFQRMLNIPKRRPDGVWRTEDGKTNGLYFAQEISSLNGTRTNRILFTEAHVYGGGKPLNAALFSDVRFCGNDYTDVWLSENTRQPWPAQNWMGLRFLARHLVTFNFPKRTMYLKQTRTGPPVAAGAQPLMR
jgi:hypothetical protein